MENANKEDLKKHVRIYIGVFVALAFFTAVTVGVSYLGFAAITAVIVALVIATIKSSLVASFFMHLVSEKKIVLWLLGITVFFFLALLLLPVLSVYVS